MKPTDNKNIYHSLAFIYDDLMKDISYEDWADFIDEVIQTHNEEAVSLLELGCGTGSFALSLDELDYYDITATDMSEQMLAVAQEKIDYAKSTIILKKMNFTDINLTEKFDAVVMLFDSMNYCQNADEVVHVLQQVRKVMHDESIFVFDFTTPVNSKRAEESLDEEGISGNFRFKRENRYLPFENIHYNEFVIEELDEEGEVKSKLMEVHKQRIYTLGEIKNCINKAGFEFVAAYEGFDLVDATEQSDRITVVVR